MTALRAIELGALLVASAAGLLRWLRVAQREHYLAGSVSRFAYRWWVSRPINLVAVIVAISAAIVSCFVTGFGLVVAVAMVFAPIGLTIKGRTAKLRWTRRLSTLAMVVAVLIAVVLALCGAVGSLKLAAMVAGFVALGTPVVVDVALLIVGPLEGALGGRYVHRVTEKRLKSVRPKIVAITGSYGKTTTKLYCTQLISGRFSALASPQSYNNQAGLARTVNELLVPGTEVFVAEMGAYGKGEIARMCRWLPPSVAVITAIGPVHLERFKTLETTLAAKSEITEGANVVVLNVDDERLAAFATRLDNDGRHVVRCSARRHDTDVSMIQGASTYEVFVDGTAVGEIDLDALGAVAINVACAIGVAVALGVPVEEIVARLGSLPTSPHRLQAQAGAKGAIVLDDTYNSNPAGARLALERLASLGKTAARRVVVTPGMVELGPLQFEENATFAEAASEVATDVVFVGRTNRRALRKGWESARKRSSSTTAALHEVERREQAVSFVTSSCGPGDVVLYENDLPDHYP